MTHDAHRSLSIAAPAVLLAVLFATGCPGDLGGPEPDELYGDCGHTLVVGDQCLDGICAADDVSARVFGIWKERFMDTHGLDADQFDEHLSVALIDLMERDGYHTWRIEYVFMVRWARTRQVESAELPWDLETMTDADIEAAIDLALEPAERFDIEDVVDYELALDAVAQCAAEMGGTAEANPCDIDFINQTGELVMRGTGEVDESSNECIDVEVDLETGELYQCQHEPCYVF